MSKLTSAAELVEALTKKMMTSDAANFAARQVDRAKELGQLGKVSEGQIEFFKKNPELFAKYQAADPAKQGLIRDFLKNQGVNVAAGTTAAGALASGQQSEASEGGANTDGILPALKSGYNYYKTNIQQPIADAVSRGLQASESAPNMFQTGYEQSQSAAEPLNPALQSVGRTLVDPVNLMPLPAQAAQIGLEMLPEKAHGGMISEADAFCNSMLKGK